MVCAEAVECQWGPHFNGLRGIPVTLIRNAPPLYIGTSHQFISQSFKCKELVTLHVISDSAPIGPTKRHIILHHPHHLLNHTFNGPAAHYFSRSSSTPSPDGSNLNWTLSSRIGLRPYRASAQLSSYLAPARRPMSVCFAHSRKLKASGGLGIMG